MYAYCWPERSTRLCWVKKVRMLRHLIIGVSSLLLMALSEFHAVAVFVDTSSVQQLVTIKWIMTLKSGEIAPWPFQRGSNWGSSAFSYRTIGNLIRGATSSSFRGEQFSLNFILSHHRAYSTMVQNFRKRSHTIIMYLCPQTRNP